MTTRSKITSRSNRLIDRLEDRTLFAASADVALTITGPASVVAGTDAAYTLTATNNGPAAAKGLVFLPPQGYPAGTSQKSFNITTGTDGTLKPHATNTYTLVLKVDPAVASGTNLSFAVKAITTTPDLVQANNTVTATTVVTTSADLNFVITGPSTVSAGTTATFFFSSYNSGPSDTTTAEYLPPNGFPAGITQQAFTYVSGPGGVITPGATDVYAFNVSVGSSFADGATPSWLETVTGGTPDPTPGDQSLTMSLTVASRAIPPVTVTVTPLSAEIKAGERATFTAAVKPVGVGQNVPTGSLTFTDNGTQVGVGTLDANGESTVTLSNLTVGGHSIVAHYQGDSTYVATTGGTSQTVDAIVPSTVVPIIGKLTLPPAVVAGSKLSAVIPVGLTNTGPLLTGSFTYNLYADVANTLDGQQVLVGTATQKLKLKTGGHGAYVFKPKAFPVVLPSGTYFLIAQVVDPNGLANAVATTQTITVAAPFVTLASTATIAGSTTLLFNKTGTVTVTVTNGGNIDSTGALSISLTPSADRVSASPGAPLATLSIKKTTIKAGKTAKFTLHFRRTAFVPAGSFYPFATTTFNGLTTTASAVAQYTLP